jgi:hypothetical protein
MEVVAVDLETRAELGTVYTSPTLDKYDFGSSYSPPIAVKATGLKIPNAKAVLLQVKFANNQRNVQVQLCNTTGLDIAVSWSTETGPGTPVPAPKYISSATNGMAVVRGPLVFSLHPKENVTVVKTYVNDLPARPKAVDYKISTEDTWNYGILPTKPMTFDPTPSKGWGDVLPFDTENYPFSISVSAKQLPEWGYWENSLITADLPPSPVECGGANGVKCGDEVTLKLTPFGGTNIRIAVFPWFSTPTSEEQ